MPIDIPAKLVRGRLAVTDEPIDDIDVLRKMDMAELDATKLRGIIPIANMPPASLERLYIVADDVARMALTSVEVQNGDTVKVEGTNRMYFVKNDSALGTEDGYEEYTVGAASSVPWSGVTSKPNSLAGYGIGDAAAIHHAAEHAFDGSDVITPESIKALPQDGTAVSADKLETARTIALSGAVTGTATAFNGTANITIPTTQLDGTKIKGMIPVASIPPAAIPRVVIVATDAARFALTTPAVTNGDTVKVTATGIMYLVKDDTKLNIEAGYEPYSAGAASSVPWEGVEDTPTTLAGYGITDAAAAIHAATHAAGGSDPVTAAAATKLATARTIGLSGGAVGTATSFNGTANITIPVTSLDATKLSGMVPLASIPASALDRVVTVATEAAKLALTAAQVQTGDSVYVTTTPPKMYAVVDDSKLGTAAAFLEYVAGTAASAQTVPWTGVTGKPTTIAGFGITDSPGAATVAPKDDATAAAVGVATKYAREDHVHKRPTAAEIGAAALATTAPLDLQPAGVAAGMGTATTAARADHRHEMPTLAELGAQNLPQSTTGITIDFTQDQITSDPLALQINQAIQDTIYQTGAAVQLITININKGTVNTPKDLNLSGIKARHANVTININAGTVFTNVYCMYNTTQNFILNVYGTVTNNCQMYYNRAHGSMYMYARAGSVIGTKSATDVTSGGFGMYYNDSLFNMMQQADSAVISADGATITTPAPKIYGTFYMSYNRSAGTLTQQIWGGPKPGAAAEIWGTISCNNNDAENNVLQAVVNNNTAFNGYFTATVLAKNTATSANTITLSAEVPAAWRSLIVGMLVSSGNASTTASSGNNHINYNKITAISADFKTLTLATAIAKPFPQHAVYFHYATGATKLYYGTNAQQQRFLQDLQAASAVAIYGTGAVGTYTKVTAIDTTNKIITISPALNANNTQTGTYQICSMDTPDMRSPLSTTWNVTATNKVLCNTDYGFTNCLLDNLVGCYVDGAPLPAGTKITAAAFAGTNGAYLELTLSGTPNLVAGTTALPLVIRGAKYISINCNSNNSCGNVSQMIGAYSIGSKLVIYATNMSNNKSQGAIIKGLYGYYNNGTAGTPPGSLMIGYSACDGNFGAYIASQMYGEGEIGYVGQRYSAGRYCHIYFIGTPMIRRYIDQSQNATSHTYIYGASSVKANAPKVCGYVAQLYNSGRTYAYRLNIDTNIATARIANRTTGGAFDITGTTYWHTYEASIWINTGYTFGLYTARSGLIELSNEIFITGATTAGMRLERAHINISFIATTNTKVQALCCVLYKTIVDAAFSTHWQWINGSGTAGLDLTSKLIDESGVTGILPLDKGGTGAASAQGIVQALYAPGGNKAAAVGSTLYTLAFESSGANSGYLTLQALRDRMGLGNTLAALPIAQGGTGGTTIPTALTNLGIDAFGSILYASATSATVQAGSHNVTSVTLSGNVITVAFSVAIPLQAVIIASVSDPNIVNKTSIVVSQIRPNNTSVQFRMLNSTGVLVAGSSGITLNFIALSL